MSEALDIQSMVTQLRHQAVNHRQRRLLVVSGSEPWCESVGREIASMGSDDNRLWVGSPGCNGLNSIQAGQARQWLGRETDLIIFNTWAGFDVDAFGALCGTVRAGGLMVLLTPARHLWHQWHDPENRRIAVYPEEPDHIKGRYLKRLAQLMDNSPLLSYLTEAGGSRVQPDSKPSLAAQGQQVLFPFDCCTAEQAAAVEAVRKVAYGHRRRPLVLTADRGRGKSAALGIGAASLLSDAPGKKPVTFIIVTAPAMNSADMVFKHAAKLLGCEDTKNSEIHWQGRRIVFKAPDELVQNPESCDLLLVDEAAAIPASLLQKLLGCYARIVFASTIHGYEGTGRGFAVRFRKTLDEATPQWRKLHIKEPVRWSEGDPLEAFSYDALMLKAAPVNSERLAEINWRDAHFERVDRDLLLKDDQSLNELFGLLVLAHYKTRPFDLRHLLDGPNIDIYTLRAKGHIIATALVAREGSISSELSDGIWLGQRRVRGHLLPQSLSNHLGVKQAIELRGARVLRIAVHPAIQQQGLGLYLLGKVSDQTRAEGTDYIGSLFGATVELLAFWQKSGFKSLRVGLTREASSGCHSVMMIKPLSAAGEQLVAKGQQKFSTQFPWLLADGLQPLEADIVLRLLLDVNQSSVSELTEDDWQDIESFALGSRLYESCIGAIKKLTLWVLCSIHLRQQLEREQRQVLVYKVLQQHPWQWIAHRQKLPGKNQVMHQLRDGVKAAFYASGKNR